MPRRQRDGLKSDGAKDAGDDDTAGDDVNAFAIDVDDGAGSMTLQTDEATLPTGFELQSSRHAAVLSTRKRRAVSSSVGRWRRRCSRKVHSAADGDAPAPEGTSGRVMWAVTAQIPVRFR